MGQKHRGACASTSTDDVGCRRAGGVPDGFISLAVVFLSRAAASPAARSRRGPPESVR